VEAQIDRVGNAHEGVVALVVGEGGDAALGHLVQGAGPLQGRERAAVAVGALGDAIPSFQDQAALEVERRNGGLTEEEDVRLGKAQPVVRGEELPGRLVGRGARHHEPGQGAGVAPPQAPDLLGLQLEQRAATHGPQGEGAFGAGEPQPGSLTAGHHQGRHGAIGEHLLAALPGVLPSRRIASAPGKPLDRGRRELPGAGGQHLLGGAADAGERRQIDAPGLGGQAIAGGRVEFRAEAEDVLLAVLRESTAERAEVLGGDRSDGHVPIRFGGSGRR
jgi:hypothetical protein